MLLTEPRFSRLFCLLIAGLATAGLGGCAAGPPRDAKPFWWMTGHWVSGPDEGNRRVEEYWTAPADNALIGMNRTLEDEAARIEPALVEFWSERIERPDTAELALFDPSSSPDSGR